MFPFTTLLKWVPTASLSFSPKVTGEPSLEWSGHLETQAARVTRFCPVWFQFNRMGAENNRGLKFESRTRCFPGEVFLEAHTACTLKGLAGGKKTPAQPGPAACCQHGPIPRLTAVGESLRSTWVVFLFFVHGICNYPLAKPSPSLFDIP